MGTVVYGDGQLFVGMDGNGDNLETSCGDRSEDGDQSMNVSVMYLMSGTNICPRLAVSMYCVDLLIMIMK